MLFLAGAVGDQAPVKSGDAFERPAHIGRPLAERALDALSRAQAAQADTLRGAQSVMRLPPARVRIGHRFVMPRWLGARFVDDDATLTVIRVGQVVFFGVPCDLAVELGERLKSAARSHGLEPVIAGFANDYVGYCMPERMYKQPAYETAMAFNGPKTGDLIVEELERLLEDVVQ